MQPILSYMYLRISTVLFLLVMTFGSRQASAQFTIADQDGVIPIVYDIEDSALDSIAANLLARDIETVTGQRPAVYNDMQDVEGNAIIIGDLSSDLISSHIDSSRLAGQWETYSRIFKDSPAAGIDQAMFIAGSDPRGMAYGVFDLSKEIGVSPWYWWADVPVEKKNSLSVSSRDTFSTSPSVKYRGVFLNDEGWGLEPWASKTFEPSVGNMGSETYAKIFELLLRLKANMLWPAMHPNTEPFFQVPGNPETARKWEIVVGSSHAEPMLRNNVGEWDHEKMGDFNYQTNASTVYDYWEQRVKQSRGVNAIYTVGMRGIHDSGMEGVDNMDEKVSSLDKVISDQRGLLKKYINEDVSEVPQSFTPYKEVLEIYESGLEVPEDITITWPDDNYGHIRRYSNEVEQRRSGGAGVYFHLSYLGDPHPYLWLSSTSPSHIWREMTRAWLHNMDQIWIANVGDLKRREWETEFFMDLAWDIDSWGPENIRDYFEAVASRDISRDHATQISEMMWKYYRLAAERKPEFMGFNIHWAGWSPIQDPLYSLWHYNDEVEKRMRSYQKLQTRAKKLMEEIPEEASDTYFELVYYPIAGATAMNEKWLYAYKSRAYAKQGRAVANQLSDSAFAAFEEIQQITHHYNHDVAGGKWEHIVDYIPGYEKGSSVFWEPITTRVETEDVRGLGVAIEGQQDLIKPLEGNLPKVTTRESKIKMSASEASISGELTTGTDSAGMYLRWPEGETERMITGPESFDTIPYEVESQTKAVFEFYLEDQPGGIHTLNLSVDHPDQNSDSWWVTLNDKAPVSVNDTAGKIQKLKVEDYVLQPGKNTLTIHPREDGAKLYGIELGQESRQLSPQYADENTLPTFNRYTRQHHFIDIFSRGQEAEEWSAKTSESWIELSDDHGSLDGESERIWVTINYDEAPAGRNIKGHIEITNGQQRYRVNVSVFNKMLHTPSNGFIESNGTISMQASQYNQKQTGRAASWRSVTGLGRSGSSMLLKPMKGWYVEDLSQVGKQSPALEYEIVVTRGGAAEVIVEAMPSFPLVKSQQLRCAISINNKDPQWITFEMGEEWSQPWQDNVLEGRMVGKGDLDLEPGKYRFKLWGTDPSVNVDKIMIDFGGLKPSYLGPASTRINR